MRCRADTIASPQAAYERRSVWTRLSEDYIYQLHDGLSVLSRAGAKVRLDLHLRLSGPGTDKRGVALMVCHWSGRCLAQSSSGSEVKSTTGKLRFRKLPMAPGMKCRTGSPTLQRFHQRDK
jgi:hypothetical protein